MTYSKYKYNVGNESIAPIFSKCWALLISFLNEIFCIWIIMMGDWIYGIYKNMYILKRKSCLFLKKQINFHSKNMKIHSTELFFTYGVFSVWNFLLLFFVCVNWKQFYDLNRWTVIFSMRKTFICQIQTRPRPKNYILFL